MKKVILISLIAAPFLIVGCGGTTANTSTSTSAKITGTVPGTFIEAYCDDGTYASTTSVQNGTNKHPFSLTVPTNTPCRIVMTTNQNNPTTRVITPIKINGKNAIKLTGDTDIGYANIPATYAEATDANGDHVQDSPVDVSPATLEGTEIDDSANNNPFDKDNNGKLDTLEDKNGDNTPDGWEDTNKNGTADIFDDSNSNGKPDSVERAESGNENGNDTNRDGNNDNGNDTNSAGGNDNVNDTNSAGGNDNVNDTNRDGGNDNVNDTNRDGGNDNGNDTNRAG